MLILPYAHSYIAIALLVYINNMAIFLIPLSQAYIHKQIESKQRATTLSTINFFQSIVIMGLFLASGYLMASIDILIILQAFAICPIIAIALLLWQSQRTRRVSWTISRGSRHPLHRQKPLEPPPHTLQLQLLQSS